MRLVVLIVVHCTDTDAITLMRLGQGKAKSGVHLIQFCYWSSAKKAEPLACDCAHYGHKQPVILVAKLTKAVSLETLASRCTAETAEPSRHAESDVMNSVLESKHCVQPMPLVPSSPSWQVFHYYYYYYYQLVVGMCRRCGTPSQRSWSSVRMS